MRLASITIEDFRSITTARKIPLSDLTTLVGPNNEGKSNILRALVIALRELVATRRSQIPYELLKRTRLNIRNRRSQFNYYNWPEDCPQKIQASSSEVGSKITLEFTLSEIEAAEFKDSIGSKLNGSLPILMTFKKNSPVDISFVKQGPGQRTLFTKVALIADFLAARIDIQYIPAVRTADSARSIVDDLVRRELATVEKDERYKQALNDISSLQRPILESLSADVTKTMQEFLPGVKEAKITISEQERSSALSAISSISINDGVDTPLESKGDGVQSLAALALMRHASKSSHLGKDVIIAVEEPESHLHPGAVRQLRLVLEDLSTRYQVVLSTHNPIFTNRRDIGQNIIVNSNKAYPAKSVTEVRKILGVQVADNLTSADLILLVEGFEDKIAVIAFLKEKSSKLEHAISEGRLAIDVLQGAANLSYKARLLIDSVSRVHALLDDDKAGNLAYKKANDAHNIDAESVNFTRVGGRNEAELEDLYVEDVYDTIIRRVAGIAWLKRPQDRQKKWTDRLRTTLKVAGKPVDDATINAVKLEVAYAAAARGAAALHPSKIAPIESLISVLELKLALQGIL